MHGDIRDAIRKAGADAAMMVLPSQAVTRTSREHAQDRRHNGTKKNPYWGTE